MTESRIETTDNSRRLVHYITQPTRASIIQTILGHPKECPSLTEITYMIPSKSPGSIGEQLSDMVDNGIITKSVVPVGERSRDGPNTFYALSDDIWDLLEQHNLYVNELDGVKKDYANVEKDAKIERYEQAERPHERNSRSGE